MDTVLVWRKKVVAAVTYYPSGGSILSLSAGAMELLGNPRNVGFGVDVQAGQWVVLTGAALTKSKASPRKVSLIGATRRGQCGAGVFMREQMGIMSGRTSIKWTAVSVRDGVMRFNITPDRRSSAGRAKARPVKKEVVS